MLTKIGMLGCKLVVTHAPQLLSCNYYVCVCALLFVCVHMVLSITYKNCTKIVAHFNHQN